jgi:hypothetical protein
MILHETSIEIEKKLEQTPFHASFIGNGLNIFWFEIIPMTIYDLWKLKFSFLN